MGTSGTISVTDTAIEWPDPVDFLASDTNHPELRPDHLPEAIVDFVFDNAERMGVDPSAIGLGALVALASVMDDDWQIQPKRNDDTWTESARIWAAILGDPSILKSPLVRLVTRPIDALEAKAREDHTHAMLAYEVDHKKWKAGAANPQDEPVKPKLPRYLVEDITTETIGEILRTDRSATKTAPAKKVLCRRDELSEWIAGFDRYGNGKGGSDRGAYLRLFNGGTHTVDRIGRGSFHVPNWSACVLGGIQPGPIQKIAKEAVEDGLLQRFCYVVPIKQGSGVDRKPNSKAADAYGTLFLRLAAMPMQPDGPRVVTLSPESHLVREEFFGQVMGVSEMPDLSPRLKAALGKYTGIWSRMVLIFHLIKLAASSMKNPRAGVVDHDTVLRATRFMHDIMLPHLMLADALMFQTVQTGHARWIAGHILSKAYERITTRDITKAYRELNAPEQRRTMIEVMASLEAMGWVQAQEKTGREVGAWEVNPKVYSVFVERAQREKARRGAIVIQIREAARQRAKKA
jgi:Protein of unknown function (DUF3987)